MNIPTNNCVDWAASTVEKITGEKFDDYFEPDIEIYGIKIPIASPPLLGKSILEKEKADPTGDLVEMDLTGGKKDLESSSSLW